MLAILLSIILVIGLSPFGQTPAKAWAAPGTQKVTLKASTNGTFTVTKSDDSAFTATSSSNDVDTAATLAGNDTLDVTFNPDAGYALSKFTAKDSGNAEKYDSATKQITMPATGDVTAEATFATVKYTLTKGQVSSELGAFKLSKGSNEVSTSDATADKGSAVKVVSTAKAGYRAAGVHYTLGTDKTQITPSGLSGSGTEADPYTFTYTPAAGAEDGEVVTVYADFVPTYAVSKGNTKNGSFTVSPTIAAAGDSVVVTPSPAAGYTTVNVTYTGEDSEETNAVARDAGAATYTFTMPAEDVTVNALFSDATPTGSLSDSNAVAYLEYADVTGKTLKYYYLESQLATALSEAVAFETPLVLVDDISTSSAAINLPAGTTLDLAGNKITVETNALTASGAGVTIKDSGLAVAKGTRAAGSKGSIETKLASAITAAASADLTIDGVAVTVTNAAPAVSVPAGATVTIKGATAFTATETSANAGKAVIEAAGKLDMQAGSITVTRSADTSAGYLGVEATSGAEVALGVKGATGGPTINAFTNAVKATGAEAKVYGGTYAVRGATTGAGTADAVLLADTGAEITVEGGTFNGVTLAGMTADTGNDTDGILTVNGGKFTYSGTTGAALFTLSDATSHLNWGEFGASGKGVIQTSAVQNFIYGGTFYANPGTTADQLALGTKATENATAGTWTVQKDMSDVAVTVTSEYNAAGAVPELEVTWPATGGTKVDSSEYTAKFYASSTSTTELSSVSTRTFYAVISPTGANASHWAGTKATDLAYVIDLSTAKGVTAYLKANGSSTDLADYTAASSFKPQAGTTGLSNIHAYIKIGAGDDDIIEYDSSTGTTVQNFSITQATNPTDVGKHELTINAVNTDILSNSMTVEYEVAAKESLGNLLFGSSATATSALKFNTGTTVSIAAQDIALPTISGATLGTDYTLTVTDPDGKVWEVVTSSPTDATKQVQATLNAGSYVIANKFSAGGDYVFTAAGIPSQGYSAEDTRTATHTITKGDISAAAGKATFTLKNNNIPYTGAPITVDGSLVGGTYNVAAAGALADTDALTYGTDFDLTPKSISKAGAQPITITGIGSFTGTATVTLTVVKGTFTGMTTGNVSTMTLDPATSAPYSGALNVPTVTLKDDTNTTTLTEGVDYELHYYAWSTEANHNYSADAEVQPVNVGTYAVVAKGINGFDGSSAVRQWKITPLDISGANVTVNNKTLKFTGASYDLSKLITVKTAVGGKTTTLAYGTDYQLTPSSLTRSGTVYVYGQGNFTNRTGVYVEFSSPAVLSEAAKVSKVPTDLVFTPKGNGDPSGAQVKPGIELTNNVSGEKLVEGTDYEVEYYKAETDRTGALVKGDDGKNVYSIYVDAANLTEAGSYKAVFSGAGSYANDVTANPGDDPTLSAEFEIAKFNLGNVTIPKNAGGTTTIKVNESGTNSDEMTFNGKAQSPKVITTGQSYLEVAYTNAKGKDDTLQLVQNAGTTVNNFSTTEQTDVTAEPVAIAINGAGNYTGSIDSGLKFSVTKFDPATNAGNTAVVQFALDAAKTIWTENYTGTVGTDSANKPAIRVVIPITKSGKVTGYYEFPETTYAAEYGTGAQSVGNNGTVKVTFNGTGNAKAGVLTSSGTDDQVWGYSVASAADTLSNSNAAIEFSTGANVKYDADENGYNPTVTVKDKATLAAIGTADDYVVTYQGAKDTAPQAYDNSNPAAAFTQVGKYAFTVQVPGYAGYVTGEFAIEALDVADIDVHVYTGEKYVAYTAGTEIKRTYSGAAWDDVVTYVGSLEEDKDYTVAYSNNTNAGDATATVEGKGNYTGSVTIPFTIEKYDFSNLIVYSMDGLLYDDDDFKQYDFTGSAIEPTVVLTRSASTKALAAGTDYKLAYNDNVDAGAYSYVPTGRIFATPVDTANYEGVCEIPFYIQRIALDDVEKVISVKVADIEYGKTPSAVVTYTPAGGKAVTLKAGADYLATYANADKAGNTGEATIIGIGNYKNAVSTTFKVEQASQTLSASNKSVVFGKTVSVGAASKEGGAVSYASKTPSVATVNPTTGVVTPVKVGKATITVTAAATADGNYKATSKDIVVTVTKAANTYKVTKVKTAKVKYKSLKKKAQKLAITKVFTQTAGQGKMTYKVTKVKKGKKTLAKKNFKINATTGKITVKKGLAKGTYKVTITAKAAGNDNYNASSLVKKTVTIKVTK